MPRVALDYLYSQWPIGRAGQLVAPGSVKPTNWTMVIINTLAVLVALPTVVVVIMLILHAAGVLR